MDWIFQRSVRKQSRRVEEALILQRKLVDSKWELSADHISLPLSLVVLLFNKYFSSNHCLSCNVGFGADTVEIAYDSQRMYSSGVNVEITGEGSDSVSASVDEAASKVIVKVEEGAKDKNFEVIITPQ